MQRSSPIVNSTSLKSEHLAEIKDIHTNLFVKLNLTPTLIAKRLINAFY